MYLSHFQLNEEVAATKQELMAEKQLSEKSQKELETDLISSKHRYYQFSQQHRYIYIVMIF